jgi:hypothetical protein
MYHFLICIARSFFFFFTTPFSTSPSFAFHLCDVFFYRFGFFILILLIPPLPKSLQHFNFIVNNYPPHPFFFVRVTSPFFEIKIFSLLLSNVILMIFRPSLGCVYISLILDCSVFVKHIYYLIISCITCNDNLSSKICTDTSSLPLNTFSI